MGWADRVTRNEVNGVRSFAAYAAQEIGVPYPTKGNLFASNTLIDELFEMYPELTWNGLCGVVEWAKVNNRRFPSIVPLIHSYRFAYADGFINELNTNTQEGLDAKIAAALAQETDPEWRRRLQNSKGPGRKVVYAAWLKRIKL